MKPLRLLTAVWTLLSMVSLQLFKKKPKLLFPKELWEKTGTDVISDAHFSDHSPDRSHPHLHRNGTWWEGTRGVLQVKTFLFYFNNNFTLFLWKLFLANARLLNSARHRLNILCILKCQHLRAFILFFLLFNIGKCLLSARLKKIQEKKKQLREKTDKEIADRLAKLGPIAEPANMLTEETDEDLLFEWSAPNRSRRPHPLSYLFRASLAVSRSSQTSEVVIICFVYLSVMIRFVVSVLQKGTLCLEFYHAAEVVPHLALHTKWVGSLWFNILNLKI